MSICRNQGTIRASPGAVYTNWRPLWCYFLFAELGSILYTENEFMAAKTNIEQAQQEFIQDGYQQGAAWCLQCLGCILYIQSQYIKAKRKFRASSGTVHSNWKSSGCCMVFEKKSVHAEPIDRSKGKVEASSAAVHTG
jgi:hypothetical protein